MASVYAGLRSPTAGPATWASRVSPSSPHANGRISTVKPLPFGGAFPSLRSPPPRLRVCCAAKAETVDRVCEIVRTRLGLEPEASLGGETSFTDDLGADSLDTVEIVMALEEEFGIEVEEDGAQNITTIQAAAELIDNLIEKKAAAAAA